MSQLDTVVLPVLREAIRTLNYKRIGIIVDSLRVRGFNYKQTADIACKAAGIEPNDWETILYEVDTMESEE